MENKMQVKGNIYTAGVYYMKAIDTGKVLYVGSAGMSEHINNALSRHLYYLKRGLYTTTNKVILQREYDNYNLMFEVMLNYDSISDEKLSDVEQAHIKLNKNTICNCQQSVTRHSSNKNKLSTYKRQLANRNSNNPNNKYDENLIAEILWLKLHNYKPKQIINLYKDNNEELPSSQYISMIGISKWIYLEPIKPSFIKDLEVEHSAKYPTPNVSANTLQSVTI